MTELQPTSDVYGILVNRTTRQVLTWIDAEGQWTLPHVHVADELVWLAMVGRVNNAMRELLSADVTVLRNVYANYAADDSHVDLIYELENHTEDWLLPPQAKWINIAGLNTLPLANPEHRPLIEAELHAVTHDQFPVLRPPWASPGWFKTASTWMQEQLIRQNYVITALPDQVKSWGISCLLRASTQQGDIFFKVASSLPLFGNEPLVMQALAERYPDTVPAPIAIEAEQRWMLMQDFGAELRSMPTVERWEAALERFGQLQLQSALVIEELLTVGCLDRRLTVLSEQIDPLLSDVEKLGILPQEEMTQLYAAAPRLKAMCRELAAYHVPYALNHGDLHSGNITGQTLMFFDWTDACIAHPFLDLSTVVADVEKKGLSRNDGVVETYLKLWTAYEPMDQLRVMWQLAEPLGALHQAVSYQHIVAALEPTSKQELIEGVSFWLRRVIQNTSQ